MPTCRKRKNENDDHEEEKKERQANVMSKIQSLTPDEALAYLDDITRKWKMHEPEKKSFMESVEISFRNFGLDPESCIDPTATGHYGLSQIDAKIHEAEMEMITLYHQLREYKLLENPVTFTRVTTCFEQLFFSKRTVLCVFSRQLSVEHFQAVPLPNGDNPMELDDEYDKMLGSWSLRFRWIDSDIAPYQKLLLHMLDRAMEKQYRRQGDWCFQPVVVDGQDTHAWKPVMTIREWIFLETQKETNYEAWHWLTSNSNTPRTLEMYLTNCVDYSFPELQKDRTTFAFRNGVYRGSKNTFYPHKDSTLSHHIAACKFFDLDFPLEYLDTEDPMDIPTPYLESIMNFQNWEKDVKMWMYIFLGRLLYDLGAKDSWQVIPFCKGLASSGKCFAAGTEIMMHDRSVKKVEDILPGDVVMGDDSTPRNVLDLARGREELYAISSASGVVMTVTKEHILCLKNHTSYIEMTVAEYLRIGDVTRLTMYTLCGDTFGFSVRGVPGCQPYFGFQTDGNQRFCLADGTVTHNSTITLKVAKSFYDDIDVGTLSNNIESKFGLSQFYDKYLFVAPEIKSDLKIEQAEFQSIVSGENITINVKNKTAFSTEWLVPGILAGNEVPTWCDNSGSIQRRIVLFDFSKQVVNGDMKLGDKLAQELPTLLYKSNRMYLWATEKWSSTNIWTVLPPYFLHTRDELAATTNVLEAFLTSEDVVLNDNMFCTLEEFKSALKVYALNNNYKVKKFTWEFFRGPLAKFSVTKKRESREYKGRNMLRDFLYGVGLQEDSQNAMA